MIRLVSQRNNKFIISVLANIKIYIIFELNKLTSMANLKDSFDDIIDDCFIDGDEIFRSKKYDGFVNRRATEIILGVMNPSNSELS